MKRLITLLLLLLSLSQLSAQRDLSERRPIWFGATFGATWQTSDMKPVGGIGWGLTVARYSRISNPSPLYWGWRGRFLDGRNFGYNYHALYGIQANPVLSGYSSGTDPDTGHVYSNYKMRFDEFAFEMIVGSNTLRKHGVLLYGFGGVGMNYWKTSTNLLNESGQLYDYSVVQVNGDEEMVKSDLHTLMDDTYETNARGSGTAGQWSFMPSAGFGFGYQWSNFAIVAEHRTTWARTDLIDGTNHNSVGAPTGNNDIYHYDGLTFKWNFNSHHNTNDNQTPPPPPPNPNNYNNQPPPPNNNQSQTNTNTNNQNSNNTNNNNQNQTPVQTVQPPTVQFTTPNVDPYITTVLNQNLVVRLTNIQAANQITLTINNVNSTNFSFDPNTGTMTFSHTLLPGNNIYKVVGTNAAGSAQDVQTITYKGQTPTTPTVPPQVTITSPSTDPYTSSTATYTVTATVLNVSGASDIIVTRNAVGITNFSYDPHTHVVTFVAALQSGSNLYKIVGTNTVGTASDQVTINYGTNSNSVQPPVVTITSPSACPAQTKTQAQTITAAITNVSQASQVTVVFNNQPITNFSYMQHGANANISFTVQLVSGANPFTISATNTAGSDSKSCTITYKPTNAPPAGPDVNITTPSADPFATSNPAFTLKATVLNVAASNEITVTVNNAVLLGWTYDMNTKVLTYSTSLQPGTYNYVVTAANANGSDADQQSVVYKVAPPAVLPPDVNITNPASDPFSTSVPAVTLNATVVNVAGSSEITVKMNNATVTGWTYDMNTKVLTYNATVQIGATTFVVTASNANGSDADQQVVNYRQSTPTALPPTVNITSPSANPYTTTTAAQTITATVMNVTQQNQITVTKTGSTAVPFSFNASTHVVTFNVTLTDGTNQFTVSATNGSGSASDNTTLILNAPAVSPGNVGSRPPQGPPPTITLHVPSMSPVNTGAQQFQITMIVSGVTSQSDITVKVNNVTLTSGVTYNANSGTLMFTANLNNGANNVVVSAHNANGTTSNTLVVNYTAGSRVGGEQEPKKPEPAKEDPKKDEPKKSEPSKPAPVKEETKKPEPVKTEPKKTETAPAPSPAPAPARGSAAPTGSSTKPR